MVSCILCRTDNNDHILNFRIHNATKDIILCINSLALTNIFRDLPSISLKRPCF